MKNNGTLSLVPAPDVLNYACAIATGNGAYIDLGNHPGSCISDPGECSADKSTWSIWLMVNFTANDGDVTFLSSGTALTNGVLFARAANGNFQYGAFINSNHWIATVPEGKIADGTWFHLAFWIDAASLKLRAYINGQPIDTAPIEAQTSMFTPGTPSNGLTLGTHSASKGQKTATAAFGDLMIFEKQLSDNEIMHIHKCGVIGKYQDAVICEVRSP